MLSGYYRAGLLGLGLAAALTGATLASYIARSQSTSDGSLGMGVIGIFSVVLVGRFFGQLSTVQSACLLLAPMLAWTVELPWLRTLSPAWRNVARLACVAVPLVVVVIVAQRKFIAASTARSTPSNPSAIRDLIEK
jgi:urea transporter